MIDVRRNGMQRSGAALDRVLIDEELDGGESRDLLLALLDSTIQFRKLQGLRSQVHAHRTDPAVLRSIDDLRAARDELRELVDAADREGRRVRVRTTIEIEVATPTGRDADRATFGDAEGR